MRRQAGDKEEAREKDKQAVEKNKQARDQRREKKRIKSLAAMGCPEMIHEGVEEIQAAH